MPNPEDERATEVDGRPPGNHDDDISSLIGSDVGGYVIDGELGRGGMGVVFSATHPMIGKRAAIKVIKHSLSKNPATVERFLQEARSVNQIGHPNIVDIFAFGKLPDGRSYLVMDLLEGEPLRKRVKRAALPVVEAAQLIDEIASALVAAHDKGFIHRDLKPDNVFLVANPTGRFDLKLLDFGLAKLLPTAAINDRAYRTATGAQIGTPDYMSPEQLRGTGVDHRTDIYALGIMAFEVIARSRPHRFADGTFDLDGLTFKQALMAVPGVPAELAELIESMVATRPDERPTLTAVRAVLKRVRPTLAAAPPASGVRAIGSEMSIGAFDASALGARPVLQTPPTGSPTRDEGPRPATPPPIAAQPFVEAAPGMAIPHHSTPGMKVPAQISSPGIAVPPQPPAPQASPALQRGSGNHAATRLGVAPPPARPSQPHPVSAYRRRRESPLWLVLGLLLLLAAATFLIIVLAT